MVWLIRRGSTDAPVRRCENINCLDHKRGRGRSKRSWSEVLIHDLKILELGEEWAHNRRIWGFRIKAADF